MGRRITILALGSRGDVQPFVPLGQALQAAGHQVRVATFAAFAPLIQGAGLEFFALPGDAEGLLRTMAAGNQALGRNPLATFRAIAHSYGSLARSLPQALTGLDDSQLILNQLPSYLFGGDLAEHLGVPWAVVAVIPLIRTRYRPLVGFPRTLAWLPGYNQFSYRIGEQIGWQLFRRAVNDLRTRIWNLPALPPWGHIDALYRQHVPFICGFSAHVVPPPPDWGDQIQLTGWWFSDAPGWEPPERLRRFLATGLPPVFIGFGSMPVSDPAAVTARIVEAVRQSGQRAIVQAGWARLGGDLPPELLLVDEVPYNWLFPQLAAVVHHGGSGTTGCGFRSGVPSIIVPFAFDQLFWGERAATLGVGPAPIPYAQLTAERLAAAIGMATENQVLRQRAADLGRRVGSERGVERAVALIERL